MTVNERIKQRRKELKLSADDIAEKPAEPAANAEAAAPVKEQPKKGAEMEDGLYLITTTTCPNCAAAKERLGEAGVEYTQINADNEPQVARKLRIMQAPTLVEVKEGEIRKLTGVSNIVKYIEENAAVRR